MFRNVKYVLAVYEKGSFSEAAKSLYVSQPCLSAMIKKTEDQIGVKIFDRTSKPLKLTEHGKRFLLAYERIRGIEEEFENYLSDIRDLQSGTLSIGTNHVFASYILPPLITKFNARYPNIQVKMYEGNIFYLSDSLENSKIDLMIDNCHLESPNLTQEKLADEHLLLAVHKAIDPNPSFKESCLYHDQILEGTPLSNAKKAVSIAPFSEIPFIALRRGNDTRSRMDEIFSKEKINMKIRLEVDQLATAYNIASHQLGATLVSDTLLKNTPPLSDMHYYKLDSKKAVREIFLYRKKKQYQSGAMTVFTKMIQDFYSEQ